MFRVLLGLLAAMAATGCATMSSPPSDTSDACAIFQEKPSWWKSAKRAEARWGASPAYILAVVNQESSFNHKAKPPREDGFLFLPGKRPSSAYGYAQALDGTWAQYVAAADERGADRDDFRDAVDFISWYTKISRDRLGLSPTAYREHYLAYHEGHGGYRKGTYRGKRFLIQAANRVEANARTYASQLDLCERKLNGGWWPF
jgi:hypothetical protein